MKTYFIIIAIVILLVGVGAYIVLFQKPIQVPLENQISHPPCLSDDEIVDFPINEYYSGEDFKYPKFPLVIYVRDKNTKKEKFHFQIDGVRENYHPLEIHKCGVYVIREFNYNPKSSKQSSGYKSEFWKYTYDGKGESMLLFHEKTDENEYRSYFSTDFRINLLEKYLILEQSYPGTPSHALIIKDLKNNKDVFVFSIKNITDKHPSLEGNIGFREWTKDGRYFWGDIFIGAYVFGFLRIDVANWNVEIFKVPDGVLGGSALNIEKGYITRHPGQVWVGVDIITEQIKREWQEQGKISSIYLYNLFTKEQNLLATTTEPLWFFQPKWVSDTELEYYMPDGERKRYEIIQ